MKPPPTRESSPPNQPEVRPPESPLELRLHLPQERAVLQYGPADIPTVRSAADSYPAARTQSGTGHHSWPRAHARSHRFHPSRPPAPLKQPAIDRPELNQRS